jgi:AraC-like DNA-binding protein
LLSHVLGQIRLAGDRVETQTLSPGRGLELDPRAAYICVVTMGEVRVEDPDGRSWTLLDGDLAMLPQGGSDLRLVADGASELILGRFRFDTDSLRGMLFTLPRLIHISRIEGEDWLHGIVHFLALEASDAQPGAALMVSRLIDLVVVRTLRTWVHRGSASGWFGGLSDRRIANALQAIHERPTQKWSIVGLAGVAGMSRSSFCERFAALVGISPLRYHNECRLRLARDMLGLRNALIGEVGLSIGYESEAAFSRAYKAFFGHSPRAETTRRRAGRATA